MASGIARSVIKRPATCSPGLLRKGKISIESVAEIRSHIRKSVFIRVAKWWNRLSRKNVKLSQERWV